MDYTPPVNCNNFCSQRKSRGQVLPYTFVLTLCFFRMPKKNVHVYCICLKWYIGLVMKIITTILPQVNCKMKL